MPHQKSAQDVIADACWSFCEREQEAAAQVVRMLKAAGYVIEPDWQPIETAPIDTHVQVWDGASIEIGYKDSSWSYAGPQWFTRAFAEELTHWRPLPTPPGEDGS